MPAAPEIMGAIGEYLATFKTALDVLRGARDLIPESDEKEAASQAIEAAGKSIEEAQAALALELGYTLCKCQYHPVLCLFQKHDKTTGQEISKCPRCGTEYPPELEPLEM